MYFTDAHNQPSLPRERFEWLGKYINDVKPTHVVDGGDFDDLNSLCAHVRNESWRGKFKDTFLAELEVSNEARQILHETIKVDVIKHVTLGNHEQRLWDFEDRNPEVYGIMQDAYGRILKKYNWETTAYRDYLTLGGVDFTHIPQTVMNKPIGGKVPCNSISRDSMRDVCFGHTHALGLQECHKLGPERSVTAFNGGCFMPLGYMPNYAQGSQKNFWYGCHLIEIQNEKMSVLEMVPMSKLIERYS